MGCIRLMDTDGNTRTILKIYFTGTEIDGLMLYERNVGLQNRTVWYTMDREGGEDIIDMKSNLTAEVASRLRRALVQMEAHARGAGGGGADDEIPGFLTADQIDIAIDAIRRIRFNKPVPENSAASGADGFVNYT